VLHTADDQLLVVGTNYKHHKSVTGCKFINASATCVALAVTKLVFLSERLLHVGGVAQWKNVGLRLANIPCPALDLQLMGDHLCEKTVRYRSAN